MTENIDPALIMAGYTELANDIIDRAIKDRDNYPLVMCTWMERIPISIFGYVVGDRCGENNLRCVKKFFNTTWFEGLCELAGRDPYAIRRKYGQVIHKGQITR